MKPTLVISADVGTSIGLGHVMRSLALAQAWLDRGGRSVMVLPSSSGVDVRRLETSGVECRIAPSDDRGRASADHVAAAVADESAAGLVLDGYRYDDFYVSVAREESPELTVIDDDGAGARFAPDYLINHNPYASGRLYRGVGIGSSVLAGPAYTLLRREFLVRRGTHRASEREVRSVLITLGGGDCGETLDSVVAVLGRWAGERALRIVVVTGALAEPRSWHSESSSVRAVRDVWDLSPLMAAADIAVSAAGVTSWELACLGVPAILVVRADNQRRGASHLVSREAALTAGEPGPALEKRLAECLSMIESPHRRRIMGKHARAITDGFGADRAAMVLARGRLRLRSVEPADRRLLWSWANDPVVRRGSFAGDMIPWPTHVAWFQSRLCDRGTRLYVGVDGDERAAGQVRIEDGPGGEAVVSCSLDEGHRGRGLGKELLGLAAARFWNSNGLRDLHAYVKADNAASAKTFVAAGYRAAGIAKVDGHTALHFVLPAAGTRPIVGIDAEDRADGQ